MQEVLDELKDGKEIDPREARLTAHNAHDDGENAQSDFG